MKHLKNSIFYTDAWDAFAKVLPESRHIIGKSHTHIIESNNSNTRHHLGRFTSKSKVVSKCEYAVDNALKLELSLTDDCIFLVSKIKLFLSTFIHSRNMNSFGFIREACHVLGTTFDDITVFDDLIEYESTRLDVSDKSITELNEIASGDYWQSIIEDYKAHKIDGYEAEALFAEKYCKRLRNSYTYVLNMPLRIKARSTSKISNDSRYKSS